MSQRLLAGACAGMSATLATHPLDVVRLRLSLPHAGYTGKPTAPALPASPAICCHQLTEMLPRATINNLHTHFCLAEQCSACCLHCPSLTPRYKVTYRDVATGAASSRACREPRNEQLRFAGIGNAFLTIMRLEGAGALFKGLGPALIGIAPYAALNFASYDLLKRSIFGPDARWGLSNLHSNRQCYLQSCHHLCPFSKNPLVTPSAESCATCWHSLMRC